MIGFFSGLIENQDETFFSIERNETGFRRRSSEPKKSASEIIFEN